MTPLNVSDCTLYNSYIGQRIQAQCKLDESLLLFHNPFIHSRIILSCENIFSGYRKRYYEKNFITKNIFLMSQKVSR